MRRIAVLDAPSNLGLRPPTATSVPGCAKAPGALRDNGLLTRLNARDAGCLTPPRYDPGDWRPGDGVAHSAQIAAYSRALADRIGAILDVGEFPVVLGGDCSVLLGSGLAMHRLGEAVGGRIGLVFVDGHSDFRHPGNASYVGAAAGEDLALVTGRGQPDLASIEGRRPYFRDIDVVVMGIRAQDEYRLDLQAAGIVTRPVPALRAEGAARSAQWARDQLVDCAGYWVHVDVDVLDPAVMPAVDAPSPGGIAFPELELLLAGLVESPHCLGVEITVFDPDYDPDGEYAAEITSAVVAGLAAAHAVSPRPDLIAARADLNTAPDESTRRRRPPAPGEGGTFAAGRPARPQTASAEIAAPAAPLPAIEEALDPVPAGSRFDDEPAAHHVAAEAAESEPAEVAGTDTAAPTDHWLGAEPTWPEDEPEPASPEPPPSLPEPRPSLPEPQQALPEREQALPEPEQASPAPDPAEPADVDYAHFDPADFARVNLEHADRVQSDFEPTEPEPADAEPAYPDPADPEPADPEPAGPGPADPELVVSERAAVPEPDVRRLGRPLGSAPMLDSEPLPATRPGMLRPRVTDDERAAGFSLPVQRPAFDLGSGEPADIT